MNIIIKVINNLKEFKIILPELKRIENEIGHLKSYNSDKIFNWWNEYGFIIGGRFGIEQRLFILLIYINNKLMSYLPLQLTIYTRKFGLKFKELTFLSQTFGDQIMDIINLNLTTREIKIIFEFIKQNIKHDILRLAYLPYNSIITKLSPSHVYFHSAMPVIPICIPYIEISKKYYSKNLRDNINKFKRRITQYTEETISNKVLTSYEEIMKYKNKIFETSNSKLHNQGLHSIYSSHLGDKYISYIMSKGDPFCSIYENKNLLLSYILGYSEGNTVYCLDGAYNRNYLNKYNIGYGILALDQAVQFFSGKFNDLNLGHGLDNYKLQFTKKVLKTYQVVLPGNTSLSVLWYIKIRKNLKSINTKGLTNDIQNN